MSESRDLPNWLAICFTSGRIHKLRYDSPEMLAQQLRRVADELETVPETVERIYVEYWE